jgi:hypothetical protein
VANSWAQAVHRGSISGKVMSDVLAVWGASVTTAGIVLRIGELVTHMPASRRLAARSCGAVGVDRADGAGVPGGGPDESPAGAAGASERTVC